MGIRWDRKQVRERQARDGDGRETKISARLALGEHKSMRSS